MECVGLHHFVTVEGLEKTAPSERPRFTAPADGSAEEELRCALVVGMQMLYDWVAAGDKAARRAALRRAHGAGAAAFSDPDEARFHELYREAYAELFEIKYGHAHTVDEDEWEQDWVVVGNGTRVPPAVAAMMLSPP